MKKIIFFLCVVMCSFLLHAQQTMYICKGETYTAVEMVDAGDMLFSNSGNVITIAGVAYDVNQIDSITFTLPVFETGTQVVVSYSDATATVRIPSSISGVTYSVDGADVTLTSTNTSDDIEYLLQGNSSNGSLTYNGEYKCKFIFNGLSLTSTTKGAIDIQCGKRVAMVLNEGTTNKLADASTGSHKAALYCKGHMEFEGAGSLEVTGNYKHAISGKEYIQLKKSTGTIIIPKSGNDGIHAGQYFQMNGGLLTITNTVGDCIQAEATSDVTDESNGQMIIKGGTINLTLDSEDMKALKADSLITISGGDITINVTGDGSKAISTKGSVIINESNNPLTLKVTTSATTYVPTSGDSKYCDGMNIDGDVTISAGTLEMIASGASNRSIKVDGTLLIEGGKTTFTVTGNASKGIKAEDFKMTAGEMIFTTSGAPIVTDYDPSYCSGIKAENFDMNGGTITMNCSGIANKGISIDGTGTFTDGTINIKTTGNGGYYRLATGYDTYASTTIKCDGNLTIEGGNFTLESTGTGGKGINCDQDIVFGKEDGTGPTMSVKTSGAMYSYSGETSKSKAVKALGAITVHGGDYSVSTTTNEAEGFEGKTSVTINGGDIVIVAYDDGINSNGPITFNGGRTYVQSTGNDAIDSNYGQSGAIVINDGILIAVGTRSPEEALDCDNHAWIHFNGGTVFTMGGKQGGGSSSSPVCGQGTIYLQNVSLTANQYLTITQGGNNVYTMKIPTTLSQAYCFLSDAKLTGTCVVTRGTVEPATYESEWKGLYIDSNITTGTAVATVTLTNNYGTGGSSGGGGGRP